jgi:hypothetical protein
LNSAESGRGDIPYGSWGLRVVGLHALVFTSSASSKRVLESNPGELGVESEGSGCMTRVWSARRCEVRVCGWEKQLKKGAEDVYIYDTESGWGQGLL